jgi:tetratricopeptide (TPR) repeat protein
MKMLPKRQSRLLAQLFVLLFASTQLWACSGSQPKEDEEVKEVEVSRSEVLAEQMGMSVETVETFQEALVELDKPTTDVDKVEKLLVKVLADEPNFAEAHYNLGVVYSNSLRYDEAVGHLEKARDIEPEELDHTVALAQAYAVTEQYDKAQRLFEQVVARQPKNLTAKNNLAVLALKADKVDEAMDHVQDVLREDYENIGALATLGLINKERGNISLAKFALNEAIKLSKDNPDPDLHNNLGLVYMMEDDVPQAVIQFEAANEAEADYLESRLNLGAILVEYLAYDRASTQFGEAVRIAPKHCVARLGKAAADFGLGEAEDSASNFEYYLANCDTEHQSSHERLVKLYETKLNDPAKAATHYDELAKMATEEDRKKYFEAMANTMRSQAESDDQKTPEKQGEETAAPDEDEGEDVEASDEDQEDAETAQQDDQKEDEPKDEAKPDEEKADEEKTDEEKTADADTGGE